MAIGVKETQNLIRKIAADSTKEVSGAVRLDPREAGMATGPRLRRRSFLRPGWIPDYVAPAAAEVETWQRLDDDVYKFLHLRRPQFNGISSPPSHQFIMEVESQLQSSRRDYDPGSYLGLVRLASDLDQTRGTLVTASEKGSFYALARRLTAGRREGENFDPGQVSRFLRLVRESDPITARGMADLLRFMARAARLPLLSSIQDAPALCLSSFLQVVDLAARFNQESQGKLDFQVGPLDVFLAARSVLFNRSVSNPTFSMIRELVLEPGGLYHEDLLEWLQSVGLFGSDLTVLLPPRLSEEGFALGSNNFSALDLVTAGGARLGKTADAEAGLRTLADALIHRIQRQDLHKDYQIQTLLQHFNELLRSERRSAARVQEDRQQARFDYVQAIRRASEAAREAKTGFFPVMKPTAGEKADLAYEKAEAGIAPPNRSQLREWDETLQAIRRRLTARSPVFRAVVTQLARVRGLDTALAFGLTPGGSRCIGRFMRLLQNDDMRRRFPLPPAVWEKLEATLEGKPTAFLADFESMLLALYGFRGGLEDVQFRHRDRLGPVGDEEESSGFAASLDRPIMVLTVGILLLELGLSASAEGTDILPAGEGGGREDPLLGYAAFRRVAEEKGGVLGEDLDGLARLLWPPSEWASDWNRARAEMALPAPRLPRLGETSSRPGWAQGCERGFMQELETLSGKSGSELDPKLLLRMTEIQAFLDAASAELEADKIRTARERLEDVL